jgi:hypothetical protein
MFSEKLLSSSRAAASEFANRMWRPERQCSALDLMPRMKQAICEIMLFCPDRAKSTCMCLETVTNAFAEAYFSIASKKTIYADDAFRASETMLLLKQRAMIAVDHTKTSLGIQKANRRFEGAVTILYREMDAAIHNMFSWAGVHRKEYSVARGFPTSFVECSDSPGTLIIDT